MSTGGWLLVDPARLADEGQRRLLREMRAAHPDSFEHAGVVHVPVLRAEDHFEPTGARRIQWRCVCDCGAGKVVQTNSLRRGKTRSCGCLFVEVNLDRHGERNPRWAEAPRYAAVHWRLREYRGPASTCAGADCGGRAEDWSWVHGCPDERQEEVLGYTLSYCPHIECYEPRCKPCHKRYDSHRSP